MTGLLLVLAGLTAGLGYVAWEVRRRNMTRWLTAYVRDVPRRRPPRDDEDVHVLLCVADHSEPKEDGAGPEKAWARVRRWVEDYPRRFGAFRDSDGRPPRHTFFYPAEEYDPALLDALAGLCRQGCGEVEIH